MIKIEMQIRRAEISVVKIVLKNFPHLSIPRLFHKINSGGTVVATLSQNFLISFFSLISFPLPQQREPIHLEKKFISNALRALYAPSIDLKVA